MNQEKGNTVESANTPIVPTEEFFTALGAGALVEPGPSFSSALPPVTPEA